MGSLRPKEIQVRVGITKNMGNYESLRLDYDMKVQLDDSDKPSEAIDKTRDWLFDKMKEDIAESNGGKDFLKPKQ